jgi:NDP-sugar pyrophosphorylase family protein
MHAVIMAGGRGSRLRPYTTVLPKPLMPLGDRPILDVLLHQLVTAGVNGITISVGHLGGLIESWVSHDAGYRVPIEFAYEEEPLGTAGALANVRRPDGTFLALNGDVLTTLDFARLARSNRQGRAIATMAIKQRYVDIEYGLVHRDTEGRIERLEEKPRLEFTVSMGVYAMEPEIVDLIRPHERIDFPDLLLRAKAAGHDVQTHLHDGYWRDIGNRDDYEAAIDDFDTDPEMFLTRSAARSPSSTSANPDRRSD